MRAVVLRKEGHCKSREFFASQKAPTENKKHGPRYQKSLTVANIDQREHSDWKNAFSKLKKLIYGKEEKKKKPFDNLKTD